MSDYFLVVVAAIMIPGAILLTYFVSKLEMNLHNSGNIIGSDEMRTRTVLDGMKREERLKVLGRILDSKPYSKELAAQLSVEREKAEGCEITLNSSEESASVDDNDIENSNVDVFTDDPVQESGEKRGKNACMRAIKEHNASKMDEINVVSTSQIENLNDEQQKQKQVELDEPCSICMEEYKDNQDVIIGKKCLHMYHKECLLEWMSYKHDVCPYCRSDLFDESTFEKAAKELLGKERLVSLVNPAENFDPEVGNNGNTTIDRGHNRNEVSNGALE